MTEGSNGILDERCYAEAHCPCVGDIKDQKTKNIFASHGQSEYPGAPKQIGRCLMTEGAVKKLAVRYGIFTSNHCKMWYIMLNSKAIGVYRYAGSTLSGLYTQHFALMS